MSSEEIDAARYLAEQVERLNNTVTAQGKANREPSMASVIGQHARTSPVDTTDTGSLKGWLSNTFNDPNYVPGTFLTALNGARGTDADEQRLGKSVLDAFGVRFSEPPEGTIKATTGATGATGGYVLPNNLVDTLIKPNVQEAVYSQLMTLRTGVNVRGLDLPYRLGAPARMTFQDWNTSKENVNETYGSYTANLGTLARVMDITKQYARFSAGAAEADVIDELTKAWVLGENYYVLAGAGTGTVGSGDPTYGVYTALNVGPPQYKTAFSAASNSTVAGSAAAAFTAGLKALATRSRTATAIVLDAVSYWQVISQGSDTAGFWVSPETGPTGFSRTALGGIAFWGVPLYYDSNFDTNTGTTKACIIADWKQFRLARGMEFRIDVSDTAGTRFDYNLIGYRGEVEVGFDARPAVYSGAAQLVTAIIP